MRGNGWCLLAAGWALTAAAGTDGIDRNDPEFVTASALAIAPGDELYACAGHFAFRMECPKFNLDYCFSYESEAVGDRILTFLAGKLKMGLFAVPTGEFLAPYRQDGRKVTAYRLELPPDVKQRLWKILDDKVAEGAGLQYDFIARGCAQAALNCLLAAIEPYPVSYPPWTAKYDKTLRELFADALTDHPWNLFLLNFLVGTDVDADLPKMRRVIIPSDLVDFLRGVRVTGKPVLSGDGCVLVPGGVRAGRLWPSPLLTMSLLAIALVALLHPFGRVVGVFLLAVQTVLGLALAYLVFFSSLPATTWNWLLIPFNPLPLFLWKWRRRWALPFAVTLAVWLAFMILSPHRLTDPAYYPLVAACAIFYALSRGSRSAVGGILFRLGDALVADPQGAFGG